jgi:Tol biopolymer transport system component
MLAAGTTLGPYKILAPLGAGGMGEVYRAHDSRLGRDVAIKVLPPHLAAAPEVRARFEREARTISQLNHPHICTLYDVGHQSGVDYLVMELLEGETLAHRLEKGPLPVAEALTLGAQIADALHRAHRAGVVHRDLKPGNLMLTKSGAKLMDFGLARATVLTPEAGTLTESPTVSRPLTTEGTIVGTLQYMAPEQLEGKEADARSDLWALGCVLYEMATGKRAFEGKSQASLIAAILKEEPRPMSELRPITPPALERIVRRCLEKNPEERFQSARDLGFDLETLGATSVGASAGRQASGVVTSGRRRERFAWGIAVAAVVAAIVTPVVLRSTSRPPAPGLERFAVTAPPGGTIWSDGPSAAISPDGRRLAFTVVDSAGTQRLWIRPLESFSVQPLPGTENAFLPFWSPDSRFIAFFADGKLRKVPVEGGPPEVICDAPNGRGGSWSKDGVIVFAPLATGPLLRVSVDGGVVVEVAKPDSARGETALRFPCFLPDGRRFLYVVLPRRQGEFDIYAGALDSKERRRIMGAGSAAVYAEPGYLLFARGSRLVAQRFDTHRMQPQGKIVPLGDGPPASSWEGATLLCPPANGVLVHVAASRPNTHLVWLDRSGRPSGTVPLPPGRYEFPSLSPDGRWAAVTKLSSPTGGDIWMVDMRRAVATRVTFDGLVATGAGGVWSPDGSRIAFQYNRSGPFDIYQVLTSGAGGAQPLVQSSVVFKYPVAWSPDGKYLVFSQNDEATGWDLWLFPLEGDRKPVPYLCTPFDEITASISPDGRWLAYDSDETGSPEIYVRSFPEPGEKFRVSTSGGSAAVWSKDGRELLISSGSLFNPSGGPILSVDVETSPAFRAGTPRALFTPRQDLGGLTVSSDLQRFLAAAPVEGATPASITVMLNWQAALKR